MSLPPALARAAGAVVRRAPDGLVRAVAPRLRPWAPDDVPANPPVPGAPVRLYVGPANYAGQGTAWARAAELLPGVGAVAMTAEPAAGFRFSTDVRVPQDIYTGSHRWQTAQRRYVGRFTHVLVEACRPLFGTLHASVREPNGVWREIDELRASGLVVGLVAHGSDVRDPARHLDATPWSPFRDEQWETGRLLAVSAPEHNRRLDELEARGIPTFVSTPDLLRDRPAATWLPLVVDPSAWVTPEPPLARAVPVVVHAPTNGPVKGTAAIEPALQRLAARGVIEYRRVTGVPAEGMRDVYRDADVVLDQFALGSYGVATCEAMAAGRVVVAHVTEQVRDAVAHRAGRDLPVLEATPDTLSDVLTSVLDERSTVAERAWTEGPAFVRALHDGRASAEALAGFCGVTKA
ncbi:hypothetical protein ACTVCO_06185 [Sanguibacter sp. A247]|uniref:hypothetical protein n=1 Tax=unclassified Sanguibacter TaxID=2645534 RepID=UPI003FD7D285